MANTSSSGIGFTGVLTIVFIILKLIGEINWSWWWVLSPLWIPIVAIITIIIVGLLFFKFWETAKDIRENGFFAKW
jgi:hypothetical protein